MASQYAGTAAINLKVVTAGTRGGHLFQAVLVIGQVLAIFEGARQNIELLCVCIASLSTQVAGARYTVQAIHTYRQCQANTFLSHL